MMGKFAESTVEEAALSWLEGLGYAVLHGPDIAPDEPAAERASYSDVVLVERLRSALTRINPDLPAEAIEDAIRRITIPQSPSLFENNRAFHKLLTDGVPVEYRNADGRIVNVDAALFDFDEPGNNDWLAVNQFTVIEDRNHRRADIVVFVNGLPLAVIELKNPGDETATIRTAFDQLQTYKAEIPALTAACEANARGEQAPSLLPPAALSAAA